MSHDGEDYTQIAFLRSDIDDSTGEYTERFYHGDEPKPAPEFFKPIKPERGKSPMQMAAAARAAAGNPGRPDGGQRPRRAV